MKVIIFFMDAPSQTFENVQEGDIQYCNGGLRVRTERSSGNISWDYGKESFIPWHRIMEVYTQRDA